MYCMFMFVPHHFIFMFVSWSTTVVPLKAEGNSCVRMVR